MAASSSTMRMRGPAGPARRGGSALRGGGGGGFSHAMRGRSFNPCPSNLIRQGRCCWPAAAAWLPVARRARGADTAASGRKTRNSAPPAAGLSTSIQPSWSLTMPWLTARPSPVPCPSSLVVKNGSKILSRSAAGMPGPLSAISSMAYSAGGARSSPSLRRTIRVGGDAQRAAAGHGVDRVHEQVQADLLDLIGIAGDLGRRRHHVHVDLDPLAPDRLAQELQRLGDHRPEVHARDRRPALAREVQHLADDLRDALDLAADDAGVLDHLAGIGPRADARPAALSATLCAALLLLPIARARPPITLSGVPTSCAISAAIWPMVASFSDWRSRVSSDRRAADAALRSSRASRSEPVIALKRPAMVPISSSRSARMTRDRSPLPTASIPSSRRRSGRTTICASPARRRSPRRSPPAGTAGRSGARSRPPRRRCSARRAACPASPRVARRVVLRQLQRGGVVQRHRHRERARRPTTSRTGGRRARPGSRRRA